MEFAGGKILGEVRDRVGIVTFSNPEKRNAMSSEMWAGTCELLERFGADDAVRVVVLTGAGTQAFVAGGEIRPRSDAQEARRNGATIGAAMETIGAFAKPVVAAIEGYCLGAGVAIALEADLRIATEAARFGVPVAKLGITYPLETFRRLISVVGSAAALMLLYTGTRITAAEAERIGLVHRVVPNGELMTEALALAETIAANAPLSLAAIKRTKRHLVDGVDTRVDVEAVIAACLSSADAAEGRTAFLEKRPPLFRGV